VGVAGAHEQTIARPELIEAEFIADPFSGGLEEGDDVGDD